MSKRELREMLGVGSLFFLGIMGTSLACGLVSWGTVELFQLFFSLYVGMLIRNFHFYSYDSPATAPQVVIRKFLTVGGVTLPASLFAQAKVLSRQLSMRWGFDLTFADPRFPPWNRGLMGTC